MKAEDNSEYFKIYRLSIIENRLYKIVLIIS